MTFRRSRTCSGPAVCAHSGQQAKLALKRKNDATRGECSCSIFVGLPSVQSVFKEQQSQAVFLMRRA
jgi:hypothetical protein